MTYQSINPSTSNLPRTFGHLSAAQLEKWPAAADDFSKTWRLKTNDKRAVTFNNADTPTRAHINEFAKSAV